MEDRGSFCGGSHVDVDRTSNNDRGHGKSTDQAGADVANALSTEFTTAGRFSFEVIEFVDRFKVKQCFQ